MANSETFAIKGNILYTESPHSFTVVENGFLVGKDGKVAGVFAVLPPQFADVEVRDAGDALVVPGLVDLHLHAPQFAYRGLGMDLELLEWLNTNTFPEEAKYVDINYAEKAYRIFVDAMKNSATTRASVFATVHVPATMMLMDMLEQSGLVTYVGKVNMDRNSPDILSEADAQASLQQTREWLAACKKRYERTQPILTPRFIPSCTDGLMRGLSEIQKETGVPVQSHLSENLSEIGWVQELCPGTQSYGDAYNQFGMFGGHGCPTIMAHCVHPKGNEFELMKQNGVFVAHCPASNANLSSGVAPMRKYLEGGVKAGLGTDIAGGFSASIFRAMSDAIQHSKLRWRLQDDTLKPLTVPEAFYLGTKGGGEFFGKVGSFEEGYEFDALVIDDSPLASPRELSLVERAERLVYMAEECKITDKYVKGTKII